MISSNNKRLGLGCLLGAAAIFLTFSAHADTLLRFCTSWRSQYVDSNFGEDVFPTTAATNKPASFSHYYITNADTGVEYSAGWLDYNGCTPYITPIAYTDYKFSQGSVAYRSSAGKIYAHPDNETWGPSASFINYNYYYSTGSIPVGVHITQTFTPTTLSPRTNIMPIAGVILNKTKSLQYTNTDTYIHVDCNVDRTPSCCDTGGAYYSYNGNVCMGPGNWGSEEGSSPTNWKFILGHEIGHRLADAKNGPIGGSYSLDEGGQYCECDHVQTGSQLHCLQSLEHIGTAESEGFASFWNTAVFNDRSSAAGVHVYPKEAWVNQEPGWYVASPPTGWNLVNYHRWGETMCVPPLGAEDKGVELDWKEYFWHVWTTPDSYQTLEMSDIINVWASESSDHWDDLENRAKTIFGSTSNKYYQFKWKGQYAGVNHYAIP